jgi:hypothetical protein
MTEHLRAPSTFMLSFSRGVTSQDDPPSDPVEAPGSATDAGPRFGQPGPFTSPLKGPVFRAFSDSKFLRTNFVRPPTKGLPSPNRPISGPHPIKGRFLGLFWTCNFGWPDVADCRRPPPHARLPPSPLKGPVLGAFWDKQFSALDPNGRSADAGHLCLNLNPSPVSTPADAQRTVRGRSSRFARGRPAPQLSARPSPCSPRRWTRPPEGEDL